MKRNWRRKVVMGVLQVVAVQRTYWKSWLTGLFVGLASLLLVGQPVLAASGPVQTNPADFTPQIVSADTTVRQLVPCGSMMYAVGDFTQVKDVTNGVTYTRNGAFSFNASTGTVSSWDPNVNGIVNSLGILPDCSEAYLGGKFTSVHGTPVRDITAVNTTTGATISGFDSNANGQVEALLVAKGHLLVGGYFTSINGTARGYLASLSPATGKDDGYATLSISGNYNYVDSNGNPSATNPTRVYNFTLSPGGGRVLVTGDFTSVGGQRRQQIFMFDFQSTGMHLDSWYSLDFNAYCYYTEPFYLQDAAWSPDGSTVYVATTGYKPATGMGSNPSDPRAGLCDAAAAYPVSPGNQTNKWINYTGCDSLFAVAADTNDVYIGGHERWANNTYGCNAAGTGAVSRQGVGGLAPSNGLATSWDPTRSRGQGADDMVVTSAGLWIASDTYFTSTQCGGEYHPGICFLPY